MDWIDQTDTARPYLRTPALSPDGTQIAFVYSGDIWLVATDGGVATRVTAHWSNHRQPRWSQAGDRLAFTSNRNGGGEIYTIRLSDGALTQVTFQESASQAEAWSADDSQLYISSARERQGDAIYLVDAHGGQPIPVLTLPFEFLGDVALAPGGESMAITVVRGPWWRRGPNPYKPCEIWIYPTNGDLDAAVRLPDVAGMNRWPLWLPDRSGIYLISERDGAQNLWLQRLDGSPAQPITSFRDGRILFPSISADGRTIVFERNFELWRLDPISGVAAPIPIQLRADRKLTPAQAYTYSRGLNELALAPDGKKVAFIARGEVYADFADKETDKDLRQGLALRVTTTAARESDLAWMPDSRKLVYLSDRHGDSEVYSYEFATRTESRLTERPATKHNPCPSPDGTWIAYVCGLQEIRLINTKTGIDQAFVNIRLDSDTGIAWSPDSAWLAFTAPDEHEFSNLYLQKIGSERAQQISFLSNLTSFWPIWAPNGQFILFTTGQYRTERQVARVDLRPALPPMREAEFDKLFETKGEDRKPSPESTSEPASEPPAEPPVEPTDEPTIDDAAGDPPNPAPEPTPTEKPVAEEKPSDEKANKKGVPVEIVFDGINRRLRLLTPTQLDANALCISPDSRDLIVRATIAGKANLWTLPLDEPRAEQPLRQVTTSSSMKWAAQFAPDGKSFYFLDAGQITIRKFPNGEQSTPLYTAEVLVNYDQEKWQIFNEAWTRLRDYFYDEQFRGLDWAAIRAQYAPLIAGAHATPELYTILNLMVGELNASHTGFTPPASGSGRRDGYTGLVFDPQEQRASGRLLITRVLAESPAALAGIVPGSEIVAVDGQALTNTSLDALLQRTADRRVRLRVSGPGSQGEREVALRPVDGGRYAELRYRDWVRSNRALTEALSAGRIGYVHIPRMDYAAYQDLLVQLDSENYQKAGLVIDVRFNGGGHTATFILDLLARQSMLHSSFRGQPAVSSWHISGNRVLQRPTVLITNESSGSNTEMLSEAYRRLGLGLVVGHPTAGAVISTTQPSLIDGGNMALPHLRVATLAGEDLEGTGRPVDIDVALPLSDPARGQDTQIAAAVQALVAQLGPAT